MGRSLTTVDRVTVDIADYKTNLAVAVFNLGFNINDPITRIITVLIMEMKINESALDMGVLYCTLVTLALLYMTDSLVSITNSWRGYSLTNAFRGIHSFQFHLLDLN